MGEFDKILPVTEVKKDLLSHVKNMEKRSESIAITRNGHPAAVLLGLDDYEGLLETIEILSDKKLLHTLRKSKKEVEAGKLIPHEKVWEE